MTESESPAELASPAQTRTSRSLSLVWIVPLVALVVGGWLVFKALSEKGTEFDYGSASARLAEAAAQLRTIEEMRKKFGGRSR